MEGGIMFFYPNATSMEIEEKIKKLTSYQFKKFLERLNICRDRRQSLFYAKTWPEEGRE
jgi:hypothetical protein